MCSNNICPVQPNVRTHQCNVGDFKVPVEIMCDVGDPKAPGQLHSAKR